MSKNQADAIPFPVVTDEFGKTAGKMLEDLIYEDRSKVKKIMGDLMTESASLRGKDARNALAAMLFVYARIIIDSKDC